MLIYVVYQLFIDLPSLLSDPQANPVQIFGTIPKHESETDDAKDDKDLDLPGLTEDSQVDPIDEIGAIPELDSVMGNDNNKVSGNDIFE